MHVFKNIKIFKETFTGIKFLNMDVTKGTSKIYLKKSNVGLEIQIQDLLLNYTEVKCNKK